MESNDQPNEGYVSYQSQASDDTSFMLHRLNTKDLVDQLRITLSGEIEEAYEVNNEIKTIIKKVGVPLVNSKGLNYIINWFKGIVNSQTVQGNLKDDEYANLIAGYREQINDFVFINFNNWEIEEWAYNPIIDVVMNTIKLFLTRTLYNKERDSYNKTFQETYSNGSQNRKGLGL